MTEAKSSHKHAAETVLPPPLGTKSANLHGQHVTWRGGMGDADGWASPYLTKVPLCIFFSIYGRRTFGLAQF